MAVWSALAGEARRRRLLLLSQLPARRRTVAHQRQYRCVRCWGREGQRQVTGDGAQGRAVLAELQWAGHRRWRVAPPGGN